MDYSFDLYSALINSLLRRGFLFSTITGYSQNHTINDKLILLRHDVEASYSHALRFAHIQHALGIRGTFYFRLFPLAENERIIKEIAQLGHEIGYHYDDLSECHGDYSKAIIRFERNLNFLRQFGPVNSITMEGAPRSKFDNRLLWLGRLESMNCEKTRHETITTQNSQLVAHYSQLIAKNPNLPKFDYRDFGITTEPYFDLDFDQIFYLTDTGRRWDGWRVSVRDKVPQQDEWIRKGLVFKSTHDIIQAAEEGRLPDKIMMTFHPQRWTDNRLLWLKELLMQNVKNQVKRVLIR
ncbi:MAG: hypothetical protein A2X11_09210 [Bacteroidetes bacterium GWE2_42_24]|nr:MAG: hypothetical protein A2X11_09210 [Bacteroidetes bacterium GWE2_42_24]OFY31204.1 MAG: hypothetical protein A2X09_14830 [Bacteroidetes bacterium GWF2_43_11]HCT86484.1 hypothetical protein [Candidatus Margulisiibacteriota bacterium]